MEQLEAILVEGVGERLDSVLSHSELFSMDTVVTVHPVGMYFGASMGRLGADFRVLLYPIFERAALLQVERQIRPAETTLLTIIGGERWLDAIKAPAECDVTNEWKMTIKEDGELSPCNNQSHNQGQNQSGVLHLLSSIGHRSPSTRTRW